MTTIVRIDNPAAHTHGWQARAHVSRNRYVSRFFADGAHGGQRAAKRLAHEAPPELERQAARLKRRQQQEAQP